MARSHAGLPMRSRGSEGGGTVKSATLTGMVVAPLLSVVVAAGSLDDRSVASRIEMRVETLANREGGPVASCEVIQAKSASSSLAFASWSSLGEVAVSEPNGLRDTAGHCGGGAFPGNSPAPSG